MVALFTGGFLVFSAQALETARRRGEHALLRVLGLERRGVARLVLLEAAALGAIGALIGLALGYGLALAAMRTWGADLGAGQFRNLFPQLRFSPLGALVYFAAGTLVSILGAVLPARDAARTPPARALKAGDEQAMFSRASPALPGVALLIVGALLAYLPAINGLPLFGYAAIACLLIGTIALMPRLSRTVFEALPPLVLIARDRAALAFPLVEKLPAVPAHSIWVSEAVKDIYGFAPGMSVELPLLGKSHPFTIAGVFRDYARQHGAILIDRKDY